MANAGLRVRRLADVLALVGQLFVEFFARAFVTVHWSRLVPEGHWRIARRLNAGIKDTHQERKSRRDDGIGRLSIAPTGLGRE